MKWYLRPLQALGTWILIIVVIIGLGYLHATFDILWRIELTALLLTICGAWFFSYRNSDEDDYGKFLALPFIVFMLLGVIAIWLNYFNLFQE